MSREASGSINLWFQYLRVIALAFILTALMSASLFHCSHDNAISVLILLIGVNMGK